MKSIDLSARAKFRMSGSDRVRYLNGQVSNDVSKIGEGEVLPACVTTVKGRLEGHVFVTVEPGGGAFLIDTDPELRETLFARLGKYIIADDVELSDVTGDFLLVHELGADGEGAACERFAQPGRDRWLRPGELEGGADWMGAGAVERLRVERGVPKWGAELSEETLPAETLLDRTSVDFHKGCYVGQEVISRVQSVGRVNKSLVALTFEDGEPEAGWRLIDAAGKDVGVVTSVAISSDQRPLGLGFLKRDATALRASGGQPGENGLSCAVEIRDSAFTTQR